MSSGRDRELPEGADAEPDSAIFAQADLVGPLRPVDQAWADHVLRTDTSAALFEPSDVVIRRREAHIGGLYRMAALLSLGGDLVGGNAAGFRAVAESRALAEFMANNPAYCLDCFVLGGRCERHQSDVRTGATRPGVSESGNDYAEPEAGSDTGRQPPGQSPGHEPEWRRFGADESPSASG
jgi:hypothetical protein